MKTYIYTLEHPETNEIRYVGKTTNIKRRYHQHTNLKMTLSSTTHLNNWLKSLLKENKKPIIKILEECVENWQEREIYWIAQFKAWGFNLCNHTKGGEGHSFKHTEEAKRKLSESHKGKKRSQETTLKIETAKKKLIQERGYYHSEETRKKISLAIKGKKFSKEHIDKLKTPIYCPEDNLYFDSVGEAVIFYKSKYSNISAVLTKRNKKLKNGKTFIYV